VLEEVSACGITSSALVTGAEVLDSTAFEASACSASGALLSSSVMALTAYSTLAACSVSATVSAGFASKDSSGEESGAASCCVNFLLPLSSCLVVSCAKMLPRRPIPF